MNICRTAFAFWSVFALLPLLPAETARPNILWITSEDHGPHMGCYGDPYAVTPNVDRLAARGLRYEFVWSNAPVCAPARTTIVSGLYASSTGSEHMRSLVAAPPDKPAYPALLRAAGYYCTNNSKTDYNLDLPASLWNESSDKAHWRNRPAGAPFFAVFNSTRSHESGLRGPNPPPALHDPAKAPVPPYHPDTPETRAGWARYYDSVSAADADAGNVLAQLEADGLADDTIIFYYADHGSGMPRSKRWAGDSGLRVPLVVYIPEKFAHLRPADYSPGGASARPVSFVDFAPTLLSLIDEMPPGWMQGRAFLGAHAAPAPGFLHGFRSRMDERADLSRSVSDGRYVYIRNYRPDLPAGQFLIYQYQTPTTRIWHEFFLGGKTDPAQSAFWQPHPPEELYDLASDPYETVNLADSPSHAATKARLRAAQQAHAREIRDLGFLPEPEFFTRKPGAVPYDLARDDSAYPFDKIFAAAELAAGRDPGDTPALTALLDDSDSAVRYWAARGIAIRGADAISAASGRMRALLSDPATHVGIVAAEALVRWGGDDARTEALGWIGDRADPSANDFFTSFRAIAAIDDLGALAKPLHDRARTFPREHPSLPDSRYSGYLNRLLTNALTR